MDQKFFHKNMLQIIVIVSISILIYLDTAQCRIDPAARKLHWSYDNFPSPVTFSRQMSKQNQISKPLYHLRGAKSFSSFLKKKDSRGGGGGGVGSRRFAAVSANQSPIEAKRTARMQSLFVTLLRHKQAQNAHSERLMQSFGRQVAPDHK